LINTSTLTKPHRRLMTHTQVIKILYCFSVGLIDDYSRASFDSASSGANQSSGIWIIYLVLLQGQ